MMWNRAIFLGSAIFFALAAAGVVTLTNRNAVAAPVRPGPVIQTLGHPAPTATPILVWPSPLPRPSSIVIGKRIGPAPLRYRPKSSGIHPLTSQSAWMTGVLMNAENAQGQSCGVYLESTNTYGATFCATPPTQVFAVSLTANWTSSILFREVDFIVNGTRFACGGSGCLISLPNGTKSVQGYGVVVDIFNNDYPAGTFQAVLTDDVRQLPQCKRGCQATGGGPVAAFTGELWYDRADFSMAGPFGLQFERFNDNRSTYNNDLGSGWRHTWDANIVVRTVFATPS